MVKPHVVKQSCRPPRSDHAPLIDRMGALWKAGPSAAPRELGGRPGRAFRPSACSQALRSGRPHRGLKGLGNGRPGEGGSDTCRALGTKGPGEGADCKGRVLGGCGVPGLGVWWGACDEANMQEQCSGEGTHSTHDGNPPG